MSQEERNCVTSTLGEVVGFNYFDHELGTMVCEDGQIKAIFASERGAWAVSKSDRVYFWGTFLIDGKNHGFGNRPFNDVPFHVPLPNVAMVNKKEFLASRNVAFAIFYVESDVISYSFGKLFRCSHMFVSSRSVHLTHS